MLFVCAYTPSSDCLIAKTNNMEKKLKNRCSNATLFYAILNCEERPRFNIIADYTHHITVKRDDMWWQPIIKSNRNIPFMLTKSNECERLVKALFTFLLELTYRENHVNCEALSRESIWRRFLSVASHSLAKKQRLKDQSSCNQISILLGFFFLTDLF